ncbi:MAG: hypothetical protein L0Z73_04665 [Gammaproteobacteria bacterium]|nr:hypothetical protein [Gammaproteobacteria bacterium]
MRVMWISVFLFLAVVLLSVGLYEPDENPQQLSSVVDTSIAASPFVEGEVQEKQVELAALPVGQMQAEALTAAPPIGDETPLEQPRSDAEAGQINAGTIGTSLENTGALDLNTVAPLAVNHVDLVQSEGTSQTKPVGLLARSIEQQNNQNKIAVIVHLENNQVLTKNEIQAIYQDRVTQWRDGSGITLYNLPLGDRHREKFSRRILDMSALEADAAESKRRENNMLVNPVQIKAKNIVVSYVERDPNAIAYVPLSMIREKSNVKVVMTLP